MKYNKFLAVFMAALLFVLSFWAWFKKEDSFSMSERRYLASFPAIKSEEILSGDFMTEFETWSQDQFPLRDRFRALKARANLSLLRLKENNSLYLYEGHIAERNYPVKQPMLYNAAGKINFIYEKYLAGKDTNCYLAVIPEKSAFTQGSLNADYHEIAGCIQDSFPDMTYIDLYPHLELGDYYRTDSHWRQEKIGDVAGVLLKAMKAEEGVYQLKKTEADFYGVYAGLLGIKTEPDSISYLTNETIEGCTVTSYNTGKAVEVPFYKLSALEGRDPYEMFLNGADPLVVIENPAAESGRELVIFRDSFGSSLAPLLLESYSKVTLVDIRYMQSAMLGSFLEFDNQDVLFIYSTMLLNNSLAMK